MDVDLELDLLRQKINPIDKMIFELISERLTIAEKIGKIKTQNNLPIRNYKVENEIFQRMKKLAKKLDLKEDFVNSVIKILIRESVLIQEKLDNSNTKIIKSNNKKKILVVGGLGKMGQWFSHFFESSGHYIEIVDLEKSNRFIVHKNLPSLEKFDFIIICTPLQSLEGNLNQIIIQKPPGVIFEIGSLKSPLLDTIKKGVKKKLKITSLHPLFGPNIRTLHDRNIILGNCGCEEANNKVKTLFVDTGVNIIEVDIEDHDYYISKTLGLSHAINLLFGYVISNSGIANSELIKYSSTTYLRQLRTAEEVFLENPELYHSIQHFLGSNRNHLYDSMIKGCHYLNSITETKSSEKFKSFVRICNEFFTEN